MELYLGDIPLVFKVTASPADVPGIPGLGDCGFDSRGRVPIADLGEEFGSLGVPLGVDSLEARGESLGDMRGEPEQ